MISASFVSSFGNPPAAIRDRTDGRRTRTLLPDGSVRVCAPYIVFMMTSSFSSVLLHFPVFGPGT